LTVLSLYDVSRFGRKFFFSTIEFVLEWSDLDQLYLWSYALSSPELLLLYEFVDFELSATSITILSHPLSVYLRVSTNSDTFTPTLFSPED